MRRIVEAMLGTPCVICGKVDDMITFPCKKNDGSSGLVCLYCATEAYVNKRSQSTFNNIKEKEMKKDTKATKEIKATKKVVKSPTKKPANKPEPKKRENYYYVMAPTAVYKHAVMLGDAPNPASLTRVAYSAKDPNKRWTGVPIETGVVYNSSVLLYGEDDAQALALFAAKLKSKYGKKAKILKAKKDDAAKGIIGRVVKKG